MGIKNPTDPLHYFFSCVNNKVEIHLKYRLATTLAKSKFLVTVLYELNKKQELHFDIDITHERCDDGNFTASLKFRAMTRAIPVSYTHLMVAHLPAAGRAPGSILDTGAEDAAECVGKIGGS